MSTYNEEKSFEKRSEVVERAGEDLPSARLLRLETVATEILDSSCNELTGECAKI